MHLLSIIIPAYNEVRTIRKIIERVLSVRFPVPFEVVVVDDCSVDGTYDGLMALAAEPSFEKVRVYRNAKNSGKGYSLRQGFYHARGDLVVIQDADFEYNPQEIPALLEPILNGRAAIVYGSRFLQKKCPDGMAFPNWIANLFLTGLTNFLFGTRLTDMETCYKVFKKALLEEIVLESGRFDFEPEITAKFIRRHHKILEMPIRYHGRQASEGKKIRARDFFIAFAVLVKVRFQHV
ncbi:MAG: glycosyltransferase family 2 protein [Candidatus Omnitrophota bacterium]